MEGPWVGSADGGANPSINAAMHCSCSTRGVCSDFISGSGGVVATAESLRISIELLLLLRLDSPDDDESTKLIICGRSRFDTVVTVLCLNWSSRV